jgi:hypothetical protein
MKVVCLEKFIDKHTGKLHQKGEVFTVNKERFAEILTVGKLVEEYKPEK